MMLGCLRVAIVCPFGIVLPSQETVSYDLYFIYLTARFPLILVACAHVNVLCVLSVAVLPTSRTEKR